MNEDIQTLFSSLAQIATGLGVLVTAFLSWQAKRAAKSAAEATVVNATKIDHVSEEQGKALNTAEMASEKVGEVALRVEQAKEAAVAANAVSDEQLKSIHALVNSRLTEALNTISDLKLMLKQLAPRNKRVIEMTIDGDRQVAALAKEKPKRKAKA